MHRRLPRTMVALALTVVAVIAGAGAAGAQQQAIAVSPTSVAAGGQVTVHVACDPSTSGYVLSGAMLGHGEFADVPALPFQTDSSGNFTATVRISKSVQPGSYPVSARCGGGLLSVTATLVVTPAQLAATGDQTRQLVVPGLVLLGAGVGLVGLAGLAGLGRRRATLR